MSFKLNLIAFSLVIFSLATNCVAADYTVAAYYFPGWHSDSKNIYRARDWTGWDQLKNATPKFAGHQQPKIPLCGYEDETIPSVMGKKISTAVKYGVNAFIFDWYYNNSGPYLNDALDKSFLTSNNNRLKFAVMWANHPVNGESAFVSDKTYDMITDTLVEKYFKNISYLKIDNKPYFSIYDIDVFVKNFGGVDGAAKALDKLRQKAKKAGFSDIYLSIVQMKLMSQPSISVNSLLLKLKANCVDSYVWVHRANMNNFPTTLYDDMMAGAIDHWYKSKSVYSVPFYPNVTMGWDPSPRANQDNKLKWKKGNYPYTTVLVGNTPDKFFHALTEAKKYLDKSGYKNKFITINAWNEWTEGSYLEPDTINQYKYLEAIESVFK